MPAVVAPVAIIDTLLAEFAAAAGAAAGVCCCRFGELAPVRSSGSVLF